MVGAFTPQNDWWNNADMQFAKSYASHSTLASGFGRAVEILAEAVDKRAESTELLFYPVAYYCRHYLELSLKDIVEIGEQLELIELSKTQRDKTLGRHDLMRLWGFARRVITSFYADDFASNPEPVDDAQAVIEEFAKHDPSGQQFRYAQGRNGERYLQEIPRLVNLRQLKETTGRVGTFLEGCSCGLAVALDDQAEYQAEMRAEYEAEMRAEYEADMRAEYDGW